jgi:opacity protein-like surface antigen
MRAAMLRLCVFAVSWLAVCACAYGQEAADDGRTQIPAVLRNSFFSFTVGAVSQPFSQEQLFPGFEAVSIGVPPVAARVVLFGHELNRFVSVQASYQRPVLYVKYDLGTERGTHHVRMNFGSATLRVRAPIGERLSLYGEGGLGITSRTGFTVGATPVIADAQYASVVVGGGIDYRLSPGWDLTSGVTYWPGKSDVNQPRTVFSSAGLRYTMRALPPERVQAARDAGYIFPKHVVQIEYSSGTGYGVNNFVSKTVPVFWGGHAKVDFGVAPHYERNIFHTKKMFALDVGVSAGVYKTRQNDDRFYTLSAYPLLRFTLLRRKAADLYFAYSLAGPTYISKTVLDDLDTGRHFTFQDFMGVGIFAGSRRNLNFMLKINHYSNGNIFPQNAGVKIPLTFGVGYAF